MTYFYSKYLTAFLLSLKVVLVLSCANHPVVKRQAPSPGGVPTYTIPSGKIAIINARVFDGYRLLAVPSVLVIENGVIGTDPHGATIFDARGGTIMPGLIDSHLHTGFYENVLTMRNYGITSALDMGCNGSPEACNALNVGIGYPEIKFSYAAAISAYGQVASLGLVPPSALIYNQSEAATFVADRVENNASYVKMIVEIPGFDAAELATIVDKSHAAGKKVMSHSPRHDCVSKALNAGADFIHHIATDVVINSSQVAEFVNKKAVSVPTLIQMQTIASTGFENYTYSVARQSTRELYRAGVPILAGSDATGLHTPPNLLVPMGISLHQELELLVGAGLTHQHALQAVTSKPAKYFNLTDRGIIAPGMRADLVLVRGNPQRNISKTQEIERVWIAGIEFNPFNRTIGDWQ